MADLTGWVYFDNGWRIRRAWASTVRLTDGRDLRPGELRVDDVKRSSDGRQIWEHRVVRVDITTRVLDTEANYEKHPLPVEVEGPRRSRYERLMGDDR